MSNTNDAMINSAEFANILGTSLSYVHTLRKREAGPPYIRRGRLVLYRVEDCIRYAEQHDIRFDK